VTPERSEPTVPSPLSRWFVAFKEDIISGAVSLEELVEVVDDEMQAHMVDLCPRCGTRRSRAAHGVCAVCWLVELRATHLDKRAELAAAREYTTAKQQSHRAKTCSVEGCDHEANGRFGLCWGHWKAQRDRPFPLDTEG
jgi:hypothetical protein